jgi:hypothetical protein
VLYLPVARRYTKTASMASKSATTAGAAASAAAASAFVPGAAGDDDNDDDVDIPIVVGIQLVADPPFVASAFSRLDPDRFDRIFLYDRQPKKKKGRRDRASDGRDVDDDEAAPSRRRDGDDDVVENGHGHGRGTGGHDRNELPRYTVTVVDRGIIAANSSRRHGTVAFLIPAGREAEFMFSTPPGLRAVLESANSDRLLAIATGRGHAFAGGSAQIQQELQRVCQILHYRRGGPSLSSANGKSSTRTAASSSRSSRHRTNHSRRPHELDDDTDESSHMIPFVTTSEGVGEREIVARGHSELSGEYVVEQVRGSATDGGDHDGGATTVARRLYFLSNPFVIQSEVCLRQNSATIDPTMVAFEYHRAMVSCLAGALWRQTKPGPLLATHALGRADGDHAFAPSDAPPPTIPPQGLLLGLGGGGLLHHARCVLPRTTRWTAVELDPEVACIAREHFGVDELVRSGYVDVRIGNALDVRSRGDDGDATTSTSSDGGLAFAAHSLSFIVVDVDAKDNTIGMSCPPSEFVSEAYLRTLEGLLMRSPAEVDDDDNTGATRPSGGVLVVNVSARDPSLFHEACRSIRAVFPHVLAASPGDDSINVVVVASLLKLPFAAVGVNASTSALILTSSQRPPTLDGPTGSDDAVPPSDLSEEVLRRLFDDVRVWDPLGDQSEARANSSSSNKKNNSKKKKGKSGKKKR